MTEAAKQYVRDHYLDYPLKALARQAGCGINQMLRFMDREGLTVPDEIKQKNKLSGLFKKGQPPPNKGRPMHEWASEASIKAMQAGQFRKGSLPHNTKYDGYVRLSKDGYLEIRVSKRKFELLHRKRWREEVGDIPDDHILVCRTNNRLCTCPSNWELITKTENMIRNSRHDYPKELVPTKTAIALINKKLKTLKENEE